jgi:hypothetical protein
VYEQAKSAVLKDLSPILIVLGDRLVVYRYGTRSELPYPLTAYAKLKSVAHIPLALFVLFTAIGEDPLSQQLTEELERFDKFITGVQASLSDDGFPESVRTRQQQILSASRALLANARKRGRLPQTELAAYCKQMGALQMANVNEAAKDQLDELNRSMTAFLASLNEQERASYYVVVTGAHQARAGNLQMQYFRTLLKERGPIEQRLIYAEHVFDEQEALNLLGKHVLDQRAGKAFFDDPVRLQRDVLTDAAQAYLPQLRLPR